jgi:hypothetical protein
VLGQHDPPPIIVSPALFSASTAAQRRLSVPEPHGLAVLPLTVFDSHVQRLIVGVNGQWATRATWTRITDQKFEAMLARCVDAEHLIAEIDDVVLVASRHLRMTMPLRRVAQSGEFVEVRFSQDAYVHTLGDQLFRLSMLRTLRMPREASNVLVADYQ